MTNITTGNWENSNIIGYQIVFRYVSWIILIIIAVIKWHVELWTLLDTKCLQPLWVLLQILWKILIHLNKVWTLITDDVDDGFPLVVTKEDLTIRRR